MKKRKKPAKPSTKKEKLKKTNPAKKPLAKKKKRLWGLEFLTYPKAAQQYVDQDYVNKLNDSEKEFLSKFNEEYYNNTLNKDWRKNLHSKKSRYEIYDQTNARNRDMFNKRYKFNEIGNDDVDYGVELPEHYTEFTNPEEANIEYIDKKKQMIKFMEEARASGMEEDEVVFLTKKVFGLE